MGGVRGLRREQLSAVGGGTRLRASSGGRVGKGLGSAAGMDGIGATGGEPAAPNRGGGSRGGGPGGRGEHQLCAGTARLLCALRPDGRIPHPASRPHTARPAIRCPPHGQRRRKEGEGRDEWGGGLCPSRAGAPGGSGTEELFVPAALRLFIRAADISGRPRARAPRPRCGCDPQVPPPPSIPPIRLCPTHTQWGL